MVGLTVFCFLILARGGLTEPTNVVHAGINIPPPPQNKAGDFFFNTSNAVSFSDAYFDYSGYEVDKLKELFGAVSSSAFGFNSARIQVNTKTALQRWYLDEVIADTLFTDDIKLEEYLNTPAGRKKVLSALETVFLNPRALGLFQGNDVYLHEDGIHEGNNTLNEKIPIYLVEVDGTTGRRRPYLSPLQAVEYVLSYTNRGSKGPRRAILNFCGTCTKCRDDYFPPPNLDSHGSGTIDDCGSYTAAFTNIIEYFSQSRFAGDEIQFELLNEPHTSDIQDATFRNCLLNVADLAATKRGSKSVIWPAAGWEDHAAVTYDYEQQNAFPHFDIGWHIYPWSCKTSQFGSSDSSSVCSVQEYENWVLNEQELPMRGGQLPRKVWLTEFGANLYQSDVDYFDPEAPGTPVSSDARDLKGIANVLGKVFAAGCTQLHGIFFWHGGYFFGDSYTVNSGVTKPDGKNGASFLKAVMADLNSKECADCTASSCQKERCGKCRIGVRSDLFLQDAKSLEGSERMIYV